MHPPRDNAPQESRHQLHFQAGNRWVSVVDQKYNQHETRKNGQLEDLQDENPKTKDPPPPHPTTPSHPDKCPTHYFFCFFFRRYVAVMLDEAHERTIHTDVLFGLLKVKIMNKYSKIYFR